MTKDTSESNAQPKLTSLRNLFIYLICYTICFIAICLAVFYPFIQSKTSLIWNVDGIGQYIMSLQYTRNQLGELLNNIKQGIFSFNLYDFTIGYGEDTRSFFRWEPVVFLSLLVPKESVGWAVYSVLTVFRIFLTGLAFSAYGFYMKKDKIPVMVASLTYAFASYTFYQVQRHPHFAVATIMLPLLLIGLEQVIKRKNSLFYSFCVAVSLMCSYYFLYMNTIIMGIYALLRLGEIYKEHRIKEFFQMLGRIILYYLLGCCMALPFVIPSLGRYFTSSRSISSGSGNTFTMEELLTYEDGYLKRFFEIVFGFIYPVTLLGNSTSLCVGAIAIPSVVTLFTQRIKDGLSAKLAFLLGLLFAMIPMFGFIFAAFGAINNRWCFAFVFVLCVIIMLQFDRMLEMNIFQYILCIIVGGLYVYMIKTQYTLDHLTKLTVVVLLLMLLIIGLLRFLPKIPGEARRCALLLVCCASIGFHGFFINADFVEEFVPIETADSKMLSSEFSKLKDLGDDSEFYRSDAVLMKNNAYNNAPISLNYNGTSLFNSVISSNIITYLKESENIGLGGLIRILSLDNRTVQEELACVKYVLTFEKDDHSVPYGFVKDEEKSEGELSDVYVNENLLPIAYAYDSLRDREEYEELDVLSKQQVQLEDAVVAPEDLQDFSEMPVSEGASKDVTEMQVRMTGLDKHCVEKEEHTYKITRLSDEEKKEIEQENENVPVDASIHFELDAPGNCEVYLRLVNVDIGEMKKSQIRVKVKGSGTKIINLRSEDNVYSVGTDDYTVNLGYYKDAKTLEGTISFVKYGTYTIEEFQAYTVSMESYDKNVALLQEEPFTNAVVDGDTITGDITVSGERMLSFSVPYSAGWKVYVDGEEQEIYCVNTMYMGTRLLEGDHHVELKYCSPGLKVGLLISGIATAIFILLIIISIIQVIRKKEKGVTSTHQA